MTFHVLRSLGRAQVLRKLITRHPPPPLADALLCAALALAWREQDAPYDLFTLVNQTVDAAKRNAATQPQAGFINACLRRFLRERDALIERVDRNPVAVWNHPKWWIHQIQKDWPNSWQEILAADNRHAPMTLRINARRTTVLAYMNMLNSAGLEATTTGDWGITLKHAVPVQELPGFANGVVSVQDSAAQLAAPLLLAGLTSTGVPRILDACAAPGGKAAHLLELVDCNLTVLDVDPDRCQKIHQTMQRLGLFAKVLVADAANPEDWWDGRLFDAVLLDAPCSASGIVRRHPDIPWLRRQSDIAQLVGTQAKLLKALWPLLKVGGRLLYCTCSTFRVEGEKQIQTFLAHNTDASLRPSYGHLTPLDRNNSSPVPHNPMGDHDGFYFALLEKLAV